MLGTIKLNIVKIVNIKINGMITWPNSLNSVNFVTQTTLQTPKNQEQRVAMETQRCFNSSCCVTLLTVEGKESADMVFFSQLQSALTETKKKKPWHLTRTETLWHWITFTSHDYNLLPGNEGGIYGKCGFYFKLWH